ncbi:MAG: glycerol-3-phosphate dehydrogenase [Epulopiscium sp. Nele67-Bin005]|nr:MAG: glycerol-3-phosphate dehydrogenase [Epulopiscium sp. Nele67-Bin005]
MAKITIIGAGSWGLALGLLLNEKNNEVTLWCHKQEERDYLLTYRENKRCLPAIKIPFDIQITSDLEEAVTDKDVIVIAIPSTVIRSVMKQIKPYLNEKTIIVNVAKGIENETLLTLSKVISQEVNNDVVILSGPSHAEEVARHMPTTVVVSSANMDSAIIVQDLFMTDYFRVYTNPDLIGVEIGGALKNVIAIAAGAIDGLGYGDNTKAALMTRGIAEISRLGVAMGGDISTLSGLAGFGDLIVTCTSGHSRNRRVGELIAQGMELDVAMKKINMVVEGVQTAKASYHLSKQYDIEMPIIEGIYYGLFEGASVRDVIEQLMTRDKKMEGIK